MPPAVSAAPIPYLRPLVASNPFPTAIAALNISEPLPSMVVAPSIFCASRIALLTSNALFTLLADSASPIAFAAPAGICVTAVNINGTTTLLAAKSITLSAAKSFKSLKLDPNSGKLYCKF